MGRQINFYIAKATTDVLREYINDNGFQLFNQWETMLTKFMQKTSFFIQMCYYEGEQLGKKGALKRPNMILSFFF